MIISPENARRSHVKRLSEWWPQGNRVAYSRAPEFGSAAEAVSSIQGVEVGCFTSSKYVMENVLRDRWEQDGFSFKIPEKNSYLTPKLESFKDWWRLDLDQAFRFDSDSTEYLLVNILTGVGHLAILK